MVMRHNSVAAWICACLIVGSCQGLDAQEAARQEKEGTDQGIFNNEPQARTLFDKMIEALRQPQTLSYKSDYRWDGRGRTGKSGIAPTRSG